jgi:hypothetical protein
MGIGQIRHRKTMESQFGTDVDRSGWRMPPLSSLPKPVWSTARTVGMLTMRLYLVVAVALMVVKVVQLTLGQ